jgi:hypothetical protein
LIENGVETNSSVYPSGVAFEPISSAIVPLTPGRTSLMTGCPHASVSFCATMRASVSDKPPAPKSMIQRIGLLG